MVIFCIPCLILVLYFAVLGIFFPRYRGYIREGWRCFLDKIKGRKCSASFDNKMRLAFSMWLAERNMKRLGKFFYNERNFKWTFITIGVVTTVLFCLLIIFLVYPPCTPDVCTI